MPPRRCNEFTWHEFCGLVPGAGETRAAGRRRSRRRGHAPHAAHGARGAAARAAIRSCRSSPRRSGSAWRPSPALVAKRSCARPWPSVADCPADAAATADVDWMKGVILGLRQIRGEMDISPPRGAWRRWHRAPPPKTPRTSPGTRRCWAGWPASIRCACSLPANRRRPVRRQWWATSRCWFPCRGLIDPRGGTAAPEAQAGKEPAGDHPCAGQAREPELREPCTTGSGDPGTRAHRAVRKGERKPRAADHRGRRTGRRPEGEAGSARLAPGAAKACTVPRLAA